MQTGVQIMGFTNTDKLMFTAACSVTDMADATTYYFGLLTGSALTTANQYQIPVGVKGKIRRVDLYVRVGTVGTAEDATLSIRVNDTTDYTITATLKFDVAVFTLGQDNLNIPIEPGDTIAYKLVTPTWATNPLQTRITASATIES